MPDRLNRIVASVANQLGEATSFSVLRVSERVLEQLVRWFDVDAGFLRHKDEDRRASTLVAEWPPTNQDANPDRSAVIYFHATDPLFALCEHGKKPAVVRFDPASYGYQFGISAGHQGVLPSVAAAPLVCGGMTTGVLGLVNFGKRAWLTDEIDALEAIACLFAQLQARIAAEDQLKYLADHDELTGLHNRRALVTELRDRLRPGRPGPVAVLYIDLDRLQSINDYMDHSAGDLFIRVFADRLRARIASLGMIARIGGDEFVFVPNQPMSGDDAKSFAHWLPSMLGNRVLLRGEVITRTVSIGVAVGFPGHDNCEGLLSRGDQAVLSAKRAGGNQVAAFTDTMSLASAFHNDIEFGLQGIVDSESLLVNYLPEVDIRTGDIVAAEALVRWRHPTRGLLLPDSFVGIAESLNLTEELSRWVMRTAFAEFSGWRSRGVGQSAMLRLNVSPAQLVAAGFVRSVVNMVGEFGVDAGSVCLEITERVFVSDIEATRRALVELKDAGFQIGIDDFGTGYAVLSHLKSFPIDMVKIDRGFVRELGTNTGDLAIVRAMVGLAEAFNLELVAEGVETPAAAMTLLRNGCHRVQGFLLSRPVAGDTMESLLAMRRIPMPFLADRGALASSAI